MTSIALIDYGAGNLASAGRALQAVGAAVCVTHDPAVIARADRIVLPGQGAFDQCMAGLRRHPGLLAALHEAVILRGRPFLGICVGMQLLATEGLEHGRHPGLGWIAGVCTPMTTAERLPHMGWNQTRAVGDHPVLSPLAAPGAHVYYAHSFVVTPDDPAATAAVCDHGGGFAAAIARDTLLGVQFHPEKSQKIGLAILQRFLEWRP